MKTAIPFLTLPGTCAEALAFYSDVFRAEITIHTTFRDSPLNVATDAEDLVFNAELRAGDFVLKASDNIEVAADEPGPASLMSVFAQCETDHEHHRIFDALAVGGTVVSPPNAGFAMVVDRFGISWMLAGPPATDISA